MKFYSFEVAQPIKAHFKVGGKYATTMKIPHGVMKNSGEYLEILPNQKIIQTFIRNAPDTELAVCGLLRLTVKLTTP
jgi:uncharacterized protein YndB with AHSA1/START domain